MSNPFDPVQIRRAFGRAAPGYAAVAQLQQEVEIRLLEQLDYFKRVPQRVLDAGSGPGRASARIKRRWPAAHVIALDLAWPMLRQASKQAGRWRPRYACVNADAAVLPFADSSIDVLFSNLCIQWIADLPALFAEWRRVLASDGLLLLSSFGPQTLSELRTAFAAADQGEHVSPFVPLQQLGDLLLAGGFRDPVLDVDIFTLTYRDATNLMHELRAIGAGNALRARRRSLTGKQRMQRVFQAYEPFRRAGVLPATYEVIYAQAWGPQPGQPRRSGSTDLAAMPLAQIPIRRREQ